MKRPSLAFGALLRGVLVLASLVAGCSRAPGASGTTGSASVKPPSPPAPSALPAPPVLSKGEVVSLMEGLARIHADHAKDCHRLTTELEAFEASRAGELVRAAPATYAAIEAEPPLAERLGRAMETIMTVSMGCANEPRFAALHARRQGQPMGEPASPPPAPSAASAASPK